jgi:GH43 family beta-xylosidase
VSIVMNAAVQIHAGALALVALAASCSSGGGSAGPVENPPAATCTFTNPLASGADPWVVKQAGIYHYIQSRNNGIYIATSPNLSDVIVAPATQVWAAPPAPAWNTTNIWAPELHFIDGRWYIYYAGGPAPAPFLNQRAGVLQSAGADALGPYVDKGMLYTGDEAATGADNRWAIDLTVGVIGGRRYAVWSGWRGSASTDRTPQYTYIAPMENPWTISSNRAEISGPTESWERGTELDLQEGQTFLTHGGDVFILYSTRESWLKEYRLGQLRLQSASADPMSPASWIKSGPVFTGTGGVLGVGHASFSVSPDETESWVVYHSKVSEAPGWDRVVRMQKFTWGPDGAPSFGDPVPSGQKTARPAGECR